MTYGDRDPQDATRERIAEVAELLAAGLLRLKLKAAQQSSGLSGCVGKSSLDGSHDQSMHVDPKSEGIAA